MPNDLPASDATAVPPAGRRRLSRRRVVTSVGIVLLLLVAAGAWIGVRAVLARAALDDARGLIGELRHAEPGEKGHTTDLAAQIAAQTGRARDLTSDPIWRAGEFVPVLGANLTAVRELAESSDDVATHAVQPLAPVLDALRPSAFRPDGDGIDLTALRDASAPVAAADEVVRTARERVDALADSPLLPPVEEARTEFATLLGEASSTLSTARTVTALLPSMLGADGPRNYVLIFQNNAEARALGGNPASLMQIETDAGRLRVVRQAASQDFPIRQPPYTVDLPAGSVEYGPFESYLMDTTMRPDFPTAAQLVKAYWERQFGGTVDGVMSFDPVALGYLLEATGPLTLPDGTVLTADDAAKTLVHDVYYRYSDYREQNTFFEGAASTILSALTGGSSLDLPKAGEALGRAAEEHRWLLWSANGDEQSIIQTTPLSGVLDDEVSAPSIGVFFADQSSSKMDYYLGTSVAASVGCQADSRRYDTTVDLRSLITPEESRSLPFYIGTRLWGGEKFLTDVYVFGPVGATFVDTDRPDLIVSQGTDLGRPVVRLQTFLTPQETASIRVSFTAPTTGAGSGDESTPLRVVTTPMMNPTDVSVNDSGC